MDLSYYLKNFFAVTRKSVSGTSTSLLIIFALIIFIMTSYFTIRSSVFSFVNMTSNYVTGKLYQSNKDNMGDVIYNNIDSESERFQELSHFINSLYLDFASDYSAISDITFFMKDDNNRWSKVYFDPKHILRSTPLPESSSRGIEKEDFRMKGLTSVVKTIEITGTNDKYQYILRTTAKIKLFNIFSSSLFALIAIIVTIIVISRLFALKISSVFENIVFKYENYIDQIGTKDHIEHHEIEDIKEFTVLSEALEGTIDRLNKTSTALNKELEDSDNNQIINNKILKAHSYQHLLENLRSLVDNRFNIHTLGLAIRTSYNNGFNIYSETSSRISFLSGGNFIPDLELSELTRDSLKECFEINNMSERSEILCFFYKIAGDSFGSLINFPLIYRGSYLGSLIISRIEKDAFSKEDKDYIEFLAKWIGAALEKFRSFNEKIELLTSVIITFSKISQKEAKTPKEYSVNIAKHAESMGVELGFSDNEINDLMIAALLHDIGKISMNGMDNKKHPEESAKLVFKHFPIESIKDAILHHHENWDGSGYPKGLKADEIPLYAQIISLVDFYETATSVKKWSSKKTLSFMLGKKGVSFSPELVDLFISINKDSV